MTAEKVVGAQYVVTGDSWGNACVGTLVTMEYDDGSDMPRFTLPDGNTQWIPMQAVVKLIEYSEPSEDKVTPKFAVGDFWCVNGAGRIVSQIVNDAYRELIVNHDKPKYAVGDIVVYTGGGIFSSDDWEVARRITAVDLDKQEYVMEWADGTPGGDASGSTFAEVDQNWEQFTGEIPAAKTAEQSHITAEQFAAIKVGDKLKLRTDLVSGKDCGGYWNRNMADLAERGVTPKVTRINTDSTVKAAAEDDFWYYTAEMIAEVIPAEPEFNCPELVAGQVYFIEKGFKWVFRYFPAGTNQHGDKWVGGSHIAINSISGTLHLTPTGLSIDTKWRKATAEETAKLEAAEKEHGYVPPMVNKIGTVIEAGKYYASKSYSGETAIYRVTELLDRGWKRTASYYTRGCRFKDAFGSTSLGSQLGETAVPATEAQIALYKAAVAKDTADKAFQSALKAAA